MMPYSFLAAFSAAVRRLLYALLAMCVLLVAAAGTLWYMAYGLRGTPPAHTEVPDLDRSVRIAWNDAGVATIRAYSEGDRYAALGYAHGTQRPWLVTLWRLTATGRLSEWFGENTLPLDRLTRRLGFAELAQQTYRTLPGEEQTLLHAYSEGMNAAFEGSTVQNQSEFALLGQTPDRWEPWHTLAIERLYAYLASTPPAPDSLTRQRLPPEARRFLRADSSLRRWLHLHDFHRSAAWAARGTNATHLFYRHTYGSSAIPPLQAVLLRRADQHNVAALSLPGTPFLVAGRAGGRAWALLPDGALELTQAPYDTTSRPAHERILDKEGKEHLVTVHRTEEALLLASPQPAGRPPPSPSTAAPTAAAQPPNDRPAPEADPPNAAPRGGHADSLWQVRWAGFQPVTDLEGWQALARGEPPSSGASPFRLMRAGGITADSAGRFRVFGTPARAIRFEHGLVAGPPAWTPYLAEQLEARLHQAGRDTVARLRPRQWVKADSSTWAARLAPDMLASIDSLSRTRHGTFTYEERTDIFGRAIRYLRNWNYFYDRASIGASIFDTWVAAYRRATGRLPAVRTPVDSLAASDSLRVREDRRRFRLLDDAVSQLARRYGNDIEQWRWEKVAPDTRHFPGWADSLAGRRLQALATTRYAPIELPGGGHLSTLSWGASPISSGMPAPAAYEAWLSTNQWQTLHVRRRRFDISVPFGRYRAPRRPPDPIALRFDSARTTYTTTLTPAGSTATRPLQASF